MKIFLKKDDSCTLHITIWAKEVKNVLWFIKTFPNGLKFLIEIKLRPISTTFPGCLQISPPLHTLMLISEGPPMISVVTHSGPPCYIAEFRNLGCLGHSWPLPIMIRNQNSSQEPPESSKTPDQDFKDMRVLCTFLFNVESWDLEHR